MVKLIKVFSTLLALTLIFTGCNSSDVEKKEKELAVIEEEVVDKIKSTETYAKEDIEEAISYIKDNIDKIKDADVAKKIAEYGAYLENVAKTEGEEIDHDLAKFGQESKDLATKVYTAVEDEKNKIIDNSKTTFIDWSKKLTDQKDKLVDEFHKLINK